MTSPLLLRMRLVEDGGGGLGENEDWSDAISKADQGRSISRMITRGLRIVCEGCVGYDEKEKQRMQKTISKATTMMHLRASKSLVRLHAGRFWRARVAG